MKLKWLFIQTCSLLLSILIAEAVYGQAKESPAQKIYLQLGGGGTSQDGSVSSFGVQSIFRHNWTTSFSCHSIDHLTPKNLPADYTPGYSVFLLFPIPINDKSPVSKISMYSLTGGKCFEAGRRIWFTTEAGLSVVKGERFSFTPQPVQEMDGYLGYYYSSNYSYSKQSELNGWNSESRLQLGVLAICRHWGRCVCQF